MHGPATPLLQMHCGNSVGNSASPGKGKPVLLDLLLPRSSEQTWVPWAEDIVGRELPCSMAPLRAGLFQKAPQMLTLLSTGGHFVPLSLSLPPLLISILR